MISRAERTVGYLILCLFAAFSLYPVLGILGAALSPQPSGSASVAPSGVAFGNFADAWELGRFGTYLRSSILVAVVVVIAAVTLSVMTGYAFGTMRFRGRTLLYYLFILGITIPSEAIVIPLYFDLRDLGLTDTYWALVLPQAAQSVAFGTFWMTSYFRSSSRDVVEAARIDGATHWQVLWRVLAPMGRPAILTMTVLVFMWTWNEFLLPLVMVTSESLRTAPLGLSFFQGQFTTDFGLLAAGSVIVALPIVVLYLWLQRHFVQGMLEGAIKE
jgi:raffinose/stachyose/melibiose transport system permease protein